MYNRYCMLLRGSGYSIDPRMLITAITPFYKLTKSYVQQILHAAARVCVQYRSPHADNGYHPFL